MAQINKPNTYFNTLLWTGDGATRSITGVNFQPDWVWIKKRSGADSHHVFDAVRGAGNRLLTDSTSAEGVGTNELTAFNSDGFTLSSNGAVNGSGATYVGWNWLANNTSGSSNTDGSITSTVSANTTSGFSIVKYTGTGANATIGHGLGVAPKVVIIKNRDSAVNWMMYNEAFGDNTKSLTLNSTAALDTSANFFNSTSPTSTVFSVGTNANTGGASNFIAYCFAEKKGYSKFGSYIGNGINGDGTFVYTGFKPSFILIKNADEIKNWYIYDTTRDTLQPLDLYLSPNLNNAEASFSAFNTVDALSNGFKLRGGSTGNGSETNNTGKKYIYMCFAENPLVGTNNIPATAR